MKKEYFLSVIFLLFLHSVFAANPFVKNYTIAEGLPTNKIIYAYQDTRGFIWFATDAGVIRFDGTNFKNYSVEEGLSDNIVMRIKEDASGRLWFMNMNGTLNYHLDNTIYNEKNDTLLSQLKANFYFIDFYEDEDSTLYFYNSISDVYVFKKNDTEITKLNFGLNNQRDLSLFHLNKSSDKKFLLWSAIGIYESDVLGNSAYLTPFTDYLIEKAFRIDSQNKTIAFERTGDANIYQGKKLIAKHILQSKSRYVNSFTIDSEGLFWLATYDEGLYCYDGKEIIFHLNVNQTQGVMTDNEGNIWVTSASEGIYKINREILRYQYWATESFEESGIKSLAPTNNGKLWATNGSSLYTINGEKLARMNLDLDENNLSNIYHFKDNTLLTSSIGEELHSIKETIYDEKTNTIKFGAYKKLPYKVKKLDVPFDEKTIYSYINDRLLIIDYNERLDCKVIGLRIGRINNVFVNKDNHLVINADKNYIAIDDKLSLNLPLQPFNGKTITSHLAINENYEIYNVIGNQLILREDQNIYDLTEAFRAQIDYRIKGIEYNENILFFYTTKTVYFIKNPLKIISRQALELSRLNIDFNNINDIICHDNRLYIASDDGLVSIPVSDCVNAAIQIPQPYFYSLSIGEKEVNLYTEVVNFKSKKSFSINFASLNYSSTPSNYSYMLEGIDREWINGKNTQVTYLNLPPGHYTFKLKARKSLEEYSQAVELPIVVQPTFFQRTLTKIGILLIMLSGIVLIIIFFYKRKIKQKETDNMIITLEHKALQSMMNPHFIFNALGSIQRYLLLNKAAEAGIYLSQFARLIRQNMNSLKSNSIQIDDELERLRNYIELEQFRMDNKFDFEIELDDEIDVDQVAIPSMIIQPFVENAIWHGVSSLPDKGKIWIRIKSVNEKSIKITVEDNGIGIKQSKPYSQSDQNLNMGVSLTKKRLQLIGDRYDVKSEIITAELTPGAKYPGTRVEMLVPVII
ncbi:sensor histidine kinase [Maribellus maritimus]|uniref:sensor histidine kinase n=1 Tax=Maribellus maritimus TaxID=2870838 RepID=UPI001EEC2067|nr:sensor histidine kinase [Maribellus maritimus]MCG6188767.1 histidine kinase [Maribellus maritimus]